MASLALGLRFSACVTVYFLMTTLSANTVYGYLRRVSRVEGVARTDAVIGYTTDDNMYSLEIHRGKNAKEHCSKDRTKMQYLNRFDYVELFYQDSHLASFCSPYHGITLPRAVSYYCHAVKTGVNVHVFHIDYVRRLDLGCVTARYSLEPPPAKTEEASCFRARAYQLQGECLAKNGWDPTRVSKALRFSMWLKALENKPLGVKKWILRKGVVN